MLVKRVIEAGLITAALGLAGLANADTKTPSGTLEDLKAKCDELNTNVQLKPFPITLSCSDVVYVWKFSAKGKMTLPNSREVSHAFTSKKINVPYQSMPVAQAATETDCNILEKWRTTIPNIEVELSCEELSLIDDFTSYCQNVISQRLREDPSIAIEEPTGERFDVCNGRLHK